MKQEKPTNLFMSEETRKEFEKMAATALGWSDLGDWTYKSGFLEAMIAAHNAAVLKCAESADVDRPGKTEVDKSSILKNLIQ